MAIDFADYDTTLDPPDDDRPACDECGVVHRKRCPMIFAKPRRVPDRDEQ